MAPTAQDSDVRGDVAGEEDLNEMPNAEENMDRTEEAGTGANFSLCRQLRCSSVRQFYLLQLILLLIHSHINIENSICRHLDLLRLGNIL